MAAEIDASRDRIALHVRWFPYGRSNVFIARRSSIAR